MDEKHIHDGEEMPEEENADLVELEDEEGNTLTMEIIRNFFYNGNEYVVLAQAHDCGCEECECCHDDAEEEDLDLYIMQIVAKNENGEEYEEFLPVEDDALYDKLIKVVEADFADDLEMDD